MVSLPYEEEFSDKKIPTEVRPILMKQYLKYCKKKLQEPLDKGLVRPHKSPRSCAGFYVMNACKIERGAPRLVINYEPSIWHLDG